MSAVDRSEEKLHFLERIRAFEGARLGAPQSAPHRVNVPMIDHWCDAIGDENPSYTDPEFAAESIHGGLVAPPTMLQAWTMPGLKGRTRLFAEPEPGPFELLDEAGFTSVVATNCDQEYRRYLRPEDQLAHTAVVESISEEKQTALGSGHFVTQLLTYSDQHGDVVGTMRFRILKFRPPTAQPSQELAAEGERRRARPRPGITRDNAFFWEGVEAGRLLIQRCAACARLRHPPGPMCPACHSLEWNTVEASGRATLYSFALHFHPTIPPFEAGHPVALVELAEGTRLVSELVGVEQDDIRIGMALQVQFDAVDEGFVLPRFRAADEGQQSGQRRPPVTKRRPPVTKE